MEVSAQGFIITATAVLCALTSSCKKAAPREYAILNAPAPERSETQPLAATLILEAVQVESALFENWIRENTLASNAATPLRKAAQSWIHSGNATLAETLTLSLKSGSSAKIRSEQFMLSPEGNGAFSAAKPGISMEATVTVNSESRECAVELNPTLLTSENGNPKRSNDHLSNWNGLALSSTLSLRENTYGFLGSHEVAQKLANQKTGNKRTSLFFLRADTNLPTRSPPPLISQLK